MIEWQISVTTFKKFTTMSSEKAFRTAQIVARTQSSHLEVKVAAVKADAKALKVHYAMAWLARAHHKIAEREATIALATANLAKDKEDLKNALTYVALAHGIDDGDGVK